VLDKTHKMIRIKWVRSGIGFTYRQKAIVHSLGLRKLNQIVLRQDTPQNRGIVAAVPHLLEIVPDTPVPAWASVPEHTVYAPVVAPVSAEPAPEANADNPPTESAAGEPAAETALLPDAGKPKKAAPRKKSVKASDSDSEDKPAANKGSKTSKAAKK
jgi:large subunit ribosomal protein L30